MDALDWALRDILATSTQKVPEHKNVAVIEFGDGALCAVLTRNRGDVGFV